VKKIISTLAVTAAIGLSSGVQAAPTNQTTFNNVMDEFGVLTGYRAVAAAAPLGLIGFDLSLEATSGTYEGATVVLPKVKLQKGLPGGIDLSGYYTGGTISDATLGSKTITGYGVALSYAIWEGGAASPAWNVRGSVTSLDIPGLFKVGTTGIETSMSKGFGPITPYAGIGYLMMTGTNQNTGITVSDYSATKSRYFYGLSFDLAFMNLTLEGDSTNGTNSYSVKAGFRIGD
jgi:hypothetical protein